MSSSVLTRPPGAQPLSGEPGRPTVSSSSRGRLRSVASWLGSRRHSAAWLLPLLALAGAVHRIGMARAPQRIDDEGTYTAQAYAVEQFGELAHYTYWYDHPPLGWLQIAGWTWLTDAFDRLQPAVAAGREAMLVAHLISVVLLWMLARRLHLSRPAAAAAVLVYALSPLAVQFHRTVYLDNVATPWMIAAFVLALAPRRQLLAFAASATCFAVAVLSKETFLLLLPALAWQMWRSAHPETRRYTLAVASSLFALIGVAYLLFALIRGELMPGEDRVSLLEGVSFQLVNRTASGSVFEAGTQAAGTAGIWLQLDAVLPVAATLAALACVTVRRLRPVAFAYLFLLTFMLRPGGYLPVPYVIAMLPFAALLVAAAVDEAVRRGARLLAVAAAAAAVVTAGIAAPAWGPQLRGLLLADLDQPVRQAQTWVEDNVTRDNLLLVDDALWVDLVRAGFPRENVVWYYKADTDPEVISRAPGGWSDYDYIVSTESVRTFPDASPVLEAALENSVLVASFGSGSQQVDIRRVHPQGLDALEERRERDERARAAAGADLAANPRISFPEEARAALTSGQVDPRAMVALAAAAARHELTVAGLPPAPGEEGTVIPRRTVVISAVDGQPVGAGQPTEDLVRLLEGQVAPYEPEVIERGGGQLIVRFDARTPSALLPTVSR